MSDTGPCFDARKRYVMAGASDPPEVIVLVFGGFRFKVAA